MQHKCVDITLRDRLWRQFLDKVFSLGTDVLMHVTEAYVAYTSFLQNLAWGFTLEGCVSNQEHIDYNTYAHEVLLDAAIIVALWVFKVVQFALHTYTSAHLLALQVTIDTNHLKMYFFKTKHLNLYWVVTEINWLHVDAIWIEPAVR